MRKTWKIGSCAFVFLLAGCAFQYSKEPLPARNASTSSAQLAGPLPYTVVREQVLGPRCVSCHSKAGGDKGGLNLEGYSATLGKLDEIKARVFVQRNMPPAQPLSENEAALLKAWLDRGAPEADVAAAPAGGAPAAIALNWTSIRDRIFEKRCLDCHAQPHPDGNLDLSNLNEVKANAAKIFERAVIREDMPLQPMERLPYEEKNALAQWIVRGLPE